MAGALKRSEREEEEQAGCDEDAPKLQKRVLRSSTRSASAKKAVNDK